VAACNEEDTCKGFIVQNKNPDKDIDGNYTGNIFNSTDKWHGKVYMLKSSVNGTSNNKWNGDCYTKPLSELNTNEQILFKANDDGGGGIKFDNMNEENDYFIIKNDGDQYLTYTNTNNIPEVKYEVINLNSIESKFKFKIDTLDNNENDNPFWGAGATTTNPPNYIIYPESNPNVYLTLLNDTDGEGWLTIESKLADGDSNIKRQIFSDN
jgi:hypothetical protein